MTIRELCMYVLVHLWYLLDSDGMYVIHSYTCPTWTVDNPSIVWHTCNYILQCTYVHMTD